jgi:hypothetical protein
LHSLESLANLYQISFGLLMLGMENPSEHTPLHCQML